MTRAIPTPGGCLSAMPDLDTADDQRLYAIPGSPPNLMHEKRRAMRSRPAISTRSTSTISLMPPMFKVTDTHYAATWLMHEKAPKVEHAAGA